MSADLLREAAAKLRIDGRGLVDDFADIEADPFLMAVADWLDQHADRTDILGGPASPQALAVARNYLGRDSGSAPDDLAMRLRRAVARLEERIEELPMGRFNERQRLEGKIEGVKLAASYLEEGERIFRAVGSAADREADLTSSERSTYQSLRARGSSHEDALGDALDGVHVDDVRRAYIGRDA